MTDELLPYYERELSYLRKLGSEFAQAHPKIAGRLSMDRETVEDPHVSRLLEGVAFLNARLRHKLDDDFPELSETLLAALYPHYQAPLPSMAIAQLALDPAQADMLAGYRLERGTTLESEPLIGKGVDGERCRYRTCYDVHLWPFRVVEAKFLAAPFAAPKLAGSRQPEAVLHISLETFSPTVSFSQLNCTQLRFYLNGQFQHTSTLYEVLLNETMEVAVANSPSDPRPLLLGPEAIQPVGFRRDEGLLPYPERSFLGYRLLTEYFAYPEKFLFVDVLGLHAQRLASIGNRLELFLYLPRSLRDLELNVRRETLGLGATPIINLFTQTAEPIRIGQTLSEYHLMADARRPQALEIYSVDRVVATSSARDELEFKPFYAHKHNAQSSETRAFWHATRRQAVQGFEDLDPGTEIDLALVDLDFQPAAPADWVLDTQITCLNRDLPKRLPFGGGQPKLQLTRAAPLAPIRCLTRPTPTIRPQLGLGARWKVLSHLMLNHLSLSQSENGAAALRELLTLYDFQQTPEKRAMIDGVLSVTSRPTVARMANAPGAGVCRGVEVEVKFGEEKFSGGGLFLFASVLEHFLGLYCNLNSFTRMIAKTNKRETILRIWPPRVGEQTLL